MQAPPLLAVLLAFTLLVLMHNAATPVFEAPDEVWHYNYTRWLAEGYGLPSLINDKSGANQEVAQPPLYYAVAALLSRPFPDNDLASLRWHNPGFGYQAPGTNPDNKNMLIHTTRENFPWEGAVAAIHAARLASLFFGIWSLIATWHLSCAVFCDRKSALSCAVFCDRKSALICVSLLAFHPQFVFMCSVVSNDSAATALCTTALWLLARTIKSDLKYQDIAFTGFCIGAAALTKTSAVALFPLGGIALFYFCVRNKMTVIEIIKRLLVFVGCTLLIGSWWYIRNAVLYQDPMGFSSHVDTPWGRPSPVALLQLLPEMPLLLRSFWAAYGWGHVMWPEGVYYVLYGASGLFLAISMIDLIRHRELILNPRHQNKHLDVLYPQKYSILFLMWVWLGLVVVALLNWMRQVEAPHGRLLFPAVGAWAVLLANGVLILHRGGRFHKRLSNLFLILLVSVSALAPGTRLLATFAPPRLFVATEHQLDASAVVLTYNNAARIFDIAIPDDYHKPGDPINIHACWEALAPMHSNYTIFVHLIGPDNLRVAERHTYPGLGRYPTSLWENGKAFCEDYTIKIEEWAPASVLYQLEIGLYNAENGDRLPVTNQFGQSQEPPVVGVVPVYAESSEKLTQTQVEAIFEGQIELKGVVSPQSAEAGQTISVTLQWHSIIKPEPGLKTFVHLWQPSAPQPIAQDDSIPNQGWFPTEVWQKNITVYDTHMIELPASITPGTYPLWAGLYRTGDLTRLQALGPEGYYSHDLVPIGEISIK